jgi:hypothetical protein
MYKILFFILVCSASVFAQTSKNTMKKYSKEVQKIVYNESAVFRGFKFGDAREEVKAKEPLKLHIEGDTTLLYTLYLDADDSADIIYYFDKDNKVKSFAIVFVLADGEAENSLKKQFIRYYQERYGVFELVNEEDELWKTSAAYMVEIRDTSDEAGMEIEIIYYR